MTHHAPMSALHTHACVYVCVCVCDIEDVKNVVSVQEHVL